MPGRLISNRSTYRCASPGSTRVSSAAKAGDSTSLHTARRRRWRASPSDCVPSTSTSRTWRRIIIAADSAIASVVAIRDVDHLFECHGAAILRESREADKLLRGPGPLVLDSDLPAPGYGRYAVLYLPQEGERFVVP